MGFLNWIATFTEKHAWAVVLTMVLSAIPAVYLASGLELESDFTDLLDRRARPVRDLEAVTEKLGGTAFIVVAIDARDRATAERFVSELVPKLTQLDSVLFVDGKLDLQWVRDRRLLYLTPEQLEELTDEVAGFIDARYAEQTGLFVDLTDDAGDAEKFRQRLAAQYTGGDTLPVKEYLVGNDGRYMYLFARLAGGTGNMSFGRQALDQVKSATDALRSTDAFPNDLEIRYSGSVVIRIEEDQVMSKDLQQTAVFGFLGVVLLMTLYTRRPRTLLIVSLPILISTAWTFAFARLAIGRLNIITGFLAAILFGLGVDFVIHLFLRYMEARRSGQAVAGAFRTTTTSTGRAVVSSALTTASAFIVVRFADFQGYQEFGLLAGFGIIVTMAVTLFLFPALNHLLERYVPMKGLDPQPAARRGLILPGAVRWAILIGVPLFFAYSVAQLATGQVRFHTNWRELKGESPAADFDDYIIESLGRSNTLTLVEVPPGVSVSTVKEAVEAVRERRQAAGLPTGVKRAVGIDDLVPRDQEDRVDMLADLQTQLKRIKPGTLDDSTASELDKLATLARADPFERDDVPSSLRQRFETVDGKGSLVLLLTDYLFYEVDEVISWAEEMRQLRAELDKRAADAHLMSENWIAGTVFSIILGDGPFILWAAFFGVFIVLWLDFRSIRHAIVLLSTLVVGVVCMAGAMGVLGVELNFINAVIIPSLVGIGIDGAIHVYHRFLEDGPDAMPIVLRNTSAATLLAAATTMVGFGSMIFAHHGGIRSVGELALIGVTATYLCTSVFFPLLLQAVGRRAQEDSKTGSPDGIEASPDVGGMNP